MRFYPGLTIAYWRHEVPQRDIRMCLRAIPRLRAEESIVAAMHTAVGSGSMKPAATKATIGRWTREINGGRRPPRARGPVQPQRLAAFGIQVTPQVSP